MEHAAIEVKAIEQAVADANQLAIQPLDDLQLALIGGGIGDVVWA